MVCGVCLVQTMQITVSARRLENLMTKLVGTWEVPVWFATLREPGTGASDAIASDPDDGAENARGRCSSANRHTTRWAQACMHVDIHI